MRRMPCDVVVAIASATFGVDVRERCRNNATVEARHACAAVLHEMGYASTDIGRALKVDHSTVLEARRRMDARVEAMRDQIVERLQTMGTPVGMEADAEVARLNVALTERDRRIAELEDEVRMLTRAVNRVSAERDAARQRAPRAPKPEKPTRPPEPAGKVPRRPTVTPARQRFGNLVVERLPDGRVVTTKRVA